MALVDLALAARVTMFFAFRNSPALGDKFQKPSRNTHYAGTHRRTSC